MRRIMICLTASTSLLASVAWATNSSSYTPQAAGISGDDSMTSSASASDATGGYLSNEAVGIKPQAGVLMFTDNASQDTSRLAVGFTVDWNATRFVSESPTLYFGPSTGLIYSHIGSTAGNFFGTSNAGNRTAGSNLFYIPANLKVGVNLGRDLRVSAHGGGNVIYRSIANAVNLGATSNSADSKWQVFPNVGADLELGLGRNAALLLRPDMTFTSGTKVFTATLGFATPLG